MGWNPIQNGPGCGVRGGGGGGGGVEGGVEGEKAGKAAKCMVVYGSVLSQLYKADIWLALELHTAELHAHGAVSSLSKTRINAEHVALLLAVGRRL